MPWITIYNYFFIQSINPLKGKLFDRCSQLNLGYLHFWTTFICAYGVFFPMHFLGLAGLPRRYYSNSAFPMFDGMSDINDIITFLALINLASLATNRSNMFSLSTLNLGL